MKMACLEGAALAAVLICGWVAPVQAASTGITASPASLSFSYQVNSTTLPAATKVTVTLPSGTASSTVISVTATSTVAGVPTTQGWLSATPGAGYSPLALTVTANPTGLAPGSYAGTIAIATTPVTTSLTVPVVLSVSNPPSTLLIATPYPANYALPAGSGNPTLSFTYTTGDPDGPEPASSVLNVASSGNIIPFNVTAALASAKSSSSTAVWIDVYQQGQLPSAQTSGVALSGSYVGIYVSLDATTVATLNPGAYSGTITIAANNVANGTITVNVSLVVSAGGPSLYSIYPSSVVAGPTVNPVITIYGENFFSTSVVTLQLLPANNPAIQLSSTLLSREVLQATIPAALLASQGTWMLAVANPAPPNNPGQSAVSTAFSVVSATTPVISSVVNAGSYLPTAVQTGTNTNPVSAGLTSVSPGEIISIFGQNLGPSTVTPATPSGVPLAYPQSLDAISVTFQVDINDAYFAPLLMISANQINAIVPLEVANAAVGSAIQVQVNNGGNLTAWFPVTVVNEDPGVFTFGGLGQGQGAILNYNTATQGYSINSTSSPAPRGSTILIYATGLGVLTSPLSDGAVAPANAGIPVEDPVTVQIAGQPAVVSYAGTCPGAVAGLIQINAVVPPTVAAGAAVPITVSGGTALTARQSQPGVTLVVK
jgi:uncharacterized protein (TIGR03437 family)